jgi:hypothetical protein
MTNLTLKTNEMNQLKLNREESTKNCLYCWKKSCNCPKVILAEDTFITMTEPEIEYAY